MDAWRIRVGIFASRGLPRCAGKHGWTSGGGGGRLNPTSLISGIGFPPEIAGEKVEKPGEGEMGKGRRKRRGFFRVDGQSGLVKTEARNKLDRSRCLGSFRTFQNRYETRVYIYICIIGSRQLWSRVKRFNDPTRSLESLEKLLTRR